MGEPVPIKVLFETPSGFAFFGFNGGYVNVDKPLEIIWTFLVNSATADLAIWPLEFEKFENKSDAIGTSGIDGRIAKMIKDWYCSGETILVGKNEHKLAIERELKIACRCDEVAFEVMWGLENLLPILVPDEELELCEEDHKYCSQGLHMFLQSLNYNIEPELVNRQIVETACFIYHCLEINKELLQCLRRAGYLEKESIDTQGWDALKYVTAVQIMCMDEPSSNHHQMFLEEELQKINGGKGKYKGLIKDNFMVVYRRAVEVNQVKIDKLKELDVLVKQAHKKSGRVGKFQEGLDKSERIAKKREMEDKSERTARKRKIEA